MNNKDIFKYGEEILNRINKAAESGDFSHLSRDIQSSVTNASYDIGEGIREAIENVSRSVLGKREVRTPFFSTRIDKKKGIGKIVAGSIITGYGTLGLLATIIVYAAGVEFLPLFISLLIIEALVLSAGLGLLRAGINNRHLIKNYYTFGNIIGNRPYIALRELADKTGISNNDIVRQIKQMKKRGYLPNAAIDNAETTLMLTDEVYREYTRSIQYNEQKKEEYKEEIEKLKADKEKKVKIQFYTIDKDLPNDVREILEEGNEYLNKIRYYNDLIPDTEPMSDKLYTLEATVLSIFKKLKEEPDVAGDLRKFMSYYLPTTEKLLQSYVDLRKENQDIENIKNSQREIEEATDVINDAFVKLLNQLFESSAWDISSDISVMKTMMKQDSLL